MSFKPEDGFPYYFNLAKDEELRALFSLPDTFTFLRSLAEELAVHRYAPDKWSVKQLVGHITDHERIKMFRAFLASRNDGVELWGYDQNFLVSNARFDELTIKQLVDDHFGVRQASLSFINTLSAKQLSIRGSAGRHRITIEEFLRSIIGHERHHLNIIKERYFKEWPITND